MTGTASNDNASHDTLDRHDRVYLEKLRLAADVILRHGEDPGMITDILETEVHLLRDKVERALLLPEPAADVLPWPGAPAPASGPDGPPPAV